MKTPTMEYLDGGRCPSMGVKLNGDGNIESRRLVSSKNSVTKVHPHRRGLCHGIGTIKRKAVQRGHRVLCFVLKRSVVRCGIDAGESV